MGDHARARRSGPWPVVAGDADRDVPVGYGQLVDWRRLCRRLWFLALGWAGFAVLGIGATTALSGDPAAAGALWAGVAALGFPASVVVAVALSAVGGMLRAGERRERLAGGDVGLVPPQVRRRRPVERNREGGEGA